MNICFITAGPIEWASSRMRAFWVAEALRERGHQVFVETLQSVEADGALLTDVLIWQKTVSLEIVKFHQNRGKGQRHYWDVCDPSWWWQPNECREIVQHMTGVVCSSKALEEDFIEWARQHETRDRRWVHTIPDRLKLSHFHTQRQHSDVSPVRLIWFGVAANRVALWGARANLERLVANGHKIELTIFDDRPDVRFAFSDAFPIYHVLWSLEKEVEVLAAHDVALLPPYPGPWGKVKSNNKNLTASACKLPHASGFDYRHLRQLIISVPERKYYRNPPIKKEHLVEQSAIEWEALLS